MTQPAIRCPRCNGTDLILMVPWTARSEDPSDRSNTADLVEYQCQRKEVCGLSFWLPIHTEPMKCQVNDLPGFKGIVVPPGGWKEHMVYLVRVSANAQNPVFRAILHTGFVQDRGKTLLGYCEVWNHSMDPMEARECYYLEAEKELCQIK